MRVLLVGPLFDPEMRDGAPPLGLAILATYIHKQGHKVRILDMNLHPEIGSSIESSVSASLRYKPDLVGITCWGNLSPFVIEFCSLLKSIKPDTNLVIGGEYATFKAEAIIQESKADIVVRGEGEVTFAELLKCLEDEGDLNQVKGITYVTPKGVISTPDRWPLMNMNDVPFINWKLFDNLDSYRAYRESRRLPFQASRGCPLRCIFCSVYRTWGGIERRKTPERLIEEINYYISELGLRQLHFYDDSFTLSRDWVIKICDLMQKEKTPIDWQILTRIDSVQRGMLQTLRKAGCQGIFYGVESVSPEVQSFIGKTYSESLVDRTIEETVKVGMDPQVSVIFGWPVDTPETVRHLSSFCQRMARMGVGIHQHMLFPLPGTRLTREYAAYIVRNPYPRMTQSGLARLPDKYYALMERHPEHVPDFWMFRSDMISQEETIRVFAETKLAIAEENVLQAYLYDRFGIIGRWR